MRRPASLAAIALGICLAAGPAPACGPEIDCAVGERSYRLRLPEGHDGTASLGALVFAHGYKGSAAGTMRSAAVAEAAAALGVAVVALDAAGDDWAIPGVPAHSRLPGVDELAYVDAVLADVAARLPLDRDRVVAAGFSAGGMLVWHLACHRGGAFAGFVPVAGTFWAPLPERCPDPAGSVVHIHGDADPVVPLEGRPIAEARQGDVRAALALYARDGGFGRARAERRGGLDCTVREAASGAVLDLCLFAGGHVLRAEQLTGAWRRLEAAGRVATGATRPEAGQAQ